MSEVQDETNAGTRTLPPLRAQLALEDSRHGTGPREASVKRSTSGRGVQSVAESGPHAKLDAGCTSAMASARLSGSWKAPISCARLSAIQSCAEPQPKAFGTNLT